MHPASYLQERDPLLDNPSLPDGVEWTVKGTSPLERYVLVDGVWGAIAGQGGGSVTAYTVTLQVFGVGENVTTGNDKAFLTVPALVDTQFTVVSMKED